MDKEHRQLFRAASNNNILKVQKLSRKKVNINHVDGNGDNALNLAVSNDHQEMVKYLVKRGALTYMEHTRTSTLILAIVKVNVDMVKLLLGLGVDTDKGHSEGIKMLPLCYAAAVLEVEVVELLIQHGADVRAKCPAANRTPLHEVASGLTFLFDLKQTDRRMKISKLLIEAGADINAKDKLGKTPLDLALVYNAKLSKYLIDEGALVRRESDGSTVDVIFEAAKLNDAVLVKQCLERGSDFNYTGKVNDFPISAYHYALRFTLPAVIRAFWASGCPFDLPLDGVVLRVPPPSKNNKMTKDQCLKRDTQFFAQLSLFEGIKVNDYVLVASAIAKGAVAKGVSHVYPSPLHHVAANKLHHKIASILLRKGFAVNKLDNIRKKTSLFFAILTSNPVMVKELLKFGSSVTKSDLEINEIINNEEVKGILSEVVTAFKLAKTGSSKVVKQIERFLSAGNKEMALVLMNCVDCRGRSVLGLASEKGHTKLVNKLMMMRITHFF